MATEVVDKMVVKWIDNMLVIGKKNVGSDRVISTIDSIYQ
jgi:hypothetical protein